MKVQTVLKSKGCFHESGLQLRASERSERVR